MLIKSIIKSIVYYIKYRKSGIMYHYTSKIFSGSSFEKYTKLGKEAYFEGHLGQCSYVGENSKIYGWVGRFTSIAANVEVITGVHPFKYPYVSTSPLFISDKGQAGLVIVDKCLMNEFKYADPNNRFCVIIGNDCWLGYKCSIIAGVTIGDGAVVLSHAVVTKNVPPYAIVGGVPAKIIGFRYNEQQIKDLLRIKWWDFPIEQIIKDKDLFLEIDNFLDKYK